MIEREAKTKMEKAVGNFEVRLSNIRAGRANPALLSGINVEYYGTPTPIQTLANITIPEARQLMIKPFDKSVLKDMEKAIFEADLGIAPTNNGEMIILTIPELTEERRKFYVKEVKTLAEETKIILRNIRQEANNDIKKQKLSEDQEKLELDNIQELINKYNKEIDEKFKVKEKELMTI